MIKKWKTLESKVIAQLGYFQIRSERCLLPDQREMPKYYIMDFGDWVHILPITADNQIVMLRQYRHAAGDIFLELPGGAVDSHKKEEPLLAAQRELQEETGYTSSGWQFSERLRQNYFLLKRNLF